MPARGFGSGLSAEAAAEIFSDPKTFKKRLAEFTEQKKAAEAADARARERLGELARAQEELARKSDELAARVESERAFHEQNVNEISRRQERLENKERMLSEREAEIRDMRKIAERLKKDADDIMARARAESEAASEVLAGVELMREDLKKREDALAAREARFANRVKALSEDL